MDEGTLRALLAMVAGSDVEELEVRIRGARVYLQRDPRAVSEAGPPIETASIPVEASETGSAELKLAVTSPLVGIFHPVVNVGDNVSQGQPLGAIAAMGMRTMVDAPRAGLVEALLSLDGTPVEYGQPLLVLRRDEDTADGPVR